MKKAQRNLLLGLGAALLAHWPAQAANLEKVLERGALEIAAYKDFPPYSYTEKGRRKGIDIDIGQALAEKLGVALMVRLVGADENMEDDLRNNVWKGHYIGGGTADVMMHVPFNHNNSYTRENDLVRFAAPYYREQIALVTKSEAEYPLNSVEDLKSESIGVELDTLADFYLVSGRSPVASEQVKHYTNLQLAADAFHKGEVDTLMGPRGEIEGILAQKNITARVVPVTLQGLQMQQWDVGIAMRFNHQALIESVVGAMQELKDSGKLAAIFKQHGVSYVAPSAGGVQTGYLMKVAKPEGDDD